MAAAAASVESGVWSAWALNYGADGFICVP